MDRTNDLTLRQIETATGARARANHTKRNYAVQS